MVFSVVLALSISVDALGIGMSYGLRNIAFPTASRLLLGLETFLMMEGFLFLGRCLGKVLPPSLGELFGAAFLFFFGLWLCVQGFRQVKEPPSPLAVVHQPSSCDKDASATLDPKETFLLGFILSMDSLGVGISAAAGGMAVKQLPLFAACFQILFLTLGARLGKNLTAYGHVKESLWTTISGGILMVLSCLRLF